MTVKELIVKLLEFPMDSNIELEVQTEADHKYSTGIANDVQFLRRVNGENTILISGEE